MPLKIIERLVEEERRAVRVLVRIVTNVWDDGFIHAGNLAYLSLLALFPFFIFLGTIAGQFGRSDYGMRAVGGFLATLPPSVAELLGPPIAAAINGSTSILGLSILVGIWTAASYVETIRDILRRAYHTKFVAPVWQRRLGSLALVFASVFLMLAAFAAQLIVVAVEEVALRYLPWFERLVALPIVGRFGPLVVLFVALYILFLVLTPQAFRKIGPKWPGALATTAVWAAATLLLPRVIGQMSSYDRFYGPLASVMITLLFFFIAGIGFVIGAELNAALAHTDENGQKAANSATEVE